MQLRRVIFPPGKPADNLKVLTGCRSCQVSARPTAPHWTPDSVSSAGHQTITPQHGNLTGYHQCDGVMILWFWEVRDYGLDRAQRQPANHNSTSQLLREVTSRATTVDAPSLRFELMQQDGVALAVQAYRHPTNRTMDDIAFEGDALALELGHETIEVLYLESDRAASGVTGLLLGEVGKGQAAAAGQVVFHPPVVSPVAGRARLEAERLLVELARPRHIGDRVVCEGNFLEHGTPFLATHSSIEQTDRVIPSAGWHANAQRGRVTVRIALALA